MFRSLKEFRGSGREPQHVFVGPQEDMNARSQRHCLYCPPGRLGRVDYLTQDVRAASVSR